MIGKKKSSEWKNLIKNQILYLNEKFVENQNVSK